MFALRGPVHVNSADPVAAEFAVLADTEVPAEDPEKELAVAAPPAVDVEVTVSGPEDAEGKLSDEVAAADVETGADAPDWLESTPPTEPPQATVVQIPYDPKIRPWHTAARSPGRVVRPVFSPVSQNAFGPRRPRSRSREAMPLWPRLHRESRTEDITLGHGQQS